MRVFRVLWLALAANIAVAGTVDAKGVAANNPSSVARAMKTAGYPAELGKDAAGDPLIRSQADGTDFLVNFYSCHDDNTNCSRVQFTFTVAEPRNGSLQALNGWNAENYFGRAYRNHDGGARLEMDVNLGKGGISPALFAEHLQWWSMIAASFQQLVRKAAEDAVAEKD
jgi:hypothetical protein